VQQTVVTVSSLSDPFGVFTDDVPRVRREVARHRRFVIDASHVSVFGRLRISTTSRCNNTQLP